MNDNANAIQIPVRRGAAWFFFAVWLVLGLLSIAGIIFSLYVFENESVAAGLAFLVSSLLLLTGATSQGLLPYRSLAVQGPVIEITSEGVFDQRISWAPVPWRAIEWRAVHVKSGSLQMNVDEDHRHLMRSAFGDWLSATYCKLFGFPPYTVSPQATGHSTRELEIVFSRFKAPLARGPAKTVKV